MTRRHLNRSFGRAAFGIDPHNYHASRPDYPDWVWSVLRERAGLGPGIDVLEIGAGTGLATAHLLAAQPRRLVAVEPDARLAEFLGTSLGDPRLDVQTVPFEDAVFSAGAFDLAISATAFHWLHAMQALRRTHRLLRAGGTIALLWNVFGDPRRPDAFHVATKALFAGHPISPSNGGATKLPYALDTTPRLVDLNKAGFTPDEPLVVPWTLTLDPAGVRRLYATYSNVTVLAPHDRERLLDGLEDVATREFGGVVTRNMTTSLFIARK